MSADHDYGPSRFQIFLSKDDLDENRLALHEMLCKNLPHKFERFQCSFDAAMSDGTRKAMKNNDIDDDDDLNDNNNRNIDVNGLFCCGSSFLFRFQIFILVFVCPLTPIRSIE
jgi:hypothetical protein